jgi:hypothetical protein
MDREVRIPETKRNERTESDCHTVADDADPPALLTMELLLGAKEDPITLSARGLCLGLLEADRI